MGNVVCLDESYRVRRYQSLGSLTRRHFQPSHRQLFLALLGELLERFGIEAHAYCLMDHHDHLVLHTSKGHLSRGMRHLNGLYTQRFNRTQQRDGALFRGRYKAILWRPTPICYTSPAIFTEIRWRPVSLSP